MNLSQYKLVLGALVIAESTWLFGLLGVIGLTVGIHGSPIGWLPVALLMGVSVILIRVRIFERVVPTVAGLLRGLALAVILYFGIAFRIATDADWVDLVWIWTIFSESAPEGGVLHFALGAVAAFVLWLRGAHLASIDRPIVTLSRTFRIGLIALAFAAIIDILHSDDIGIFPVMFVFFASGLGGLSVGYLMPESSSSASSKTWLKVIAIIVSIVLAIGLMKF